MSFDSRATVTSLESIFLQAARLGRQGTLSKVARLRNLAINILVSAGRRNLLRLRGRVTPVAIALSPTMHCNFGCAGCYAADYPRDDELSDWALNDLLTQAERLGVFLVIVTGGEPLLRDGLVAMLASHRRLLFLMVTNGTLVDDAQARAIARSRNIVPVVSLEGPREFTDRRRGEGAFDGGIAAMARLDRERVLFGFSATVTAENWSAVIADEFVSDMIGRGCALGFYTEYVPVASGVRPDWVMADHERKLFRQGVLAIRRGRPLIPVHLPDDEYDKHGRCLGVTGGSVHINAQGYVEPCPFAHVAVDRIGDRTLAGALESRFLKELRSSKAVVRHGHIGCALIENRALLQEIARRTGAMPTDSPRLTPTAGDASPPHSA
ncbi:MAG TPA: radical SAM protein [bacterium]|nr:radical SAM protein [bacterium]